MLSSCATTYHAKSFTGGYTDTKLATNVVLVTFKGNGFSDTADVYKMALLRSAEVCLQSGYRYFAITNTSDDSNERNVIIPSSGILPVGGIARIRKPGISLTITMAVDQKTLSGWPQVYEAAYLQRSLRSSES